MKAKQKKQAISLVVLVILLAALIVGYFAVSKMDFNEGTEGETTTDTTVTVISADSTKLTSVSFAKEGGEALTFIREGEVWFYEADRSFPANQSLLSSMATSISSVTADRQLESDNGEYGFDEPSLVVSTVYSDGTEYTLTLGETNGFNTKVYLKDQAGKVYMFSDTVTSMFSYTLRDLLQTDDVGSDIESTYVSDVTVTKADGTQNVITDSDGMSGARSSISLLDLSDWVDYAMDEESFASYGIGESSEKIAINYRAKVTVKNDDGTETTSRVPKVCEYIFGSRMTEENEDGEAVEYVYYTVNGSEILYRIELEVYEEVMAWGDYVEPETTETETEAVTETE